MKTTHVLTLTAIALAVIFALPANAQTPSFQWAKRVASTINPDDELSIGLAVDGQANCYVTGWFDGTNDFEGTVLTSAGGRDIFVAKYNHAGGLHWARRAGSSVAGSSDYWDQGRGVGVDGTGNVYVTGGFQGSADFGAFVLTPSENMAFFLAQYNNVGTVQWVRQSVGGDHVYGTGLAVDSAGNSYAVGYADNVGAAITFGGIIVPNPRTTGYSTFLVKYDPAGTAQWAQLLGGPAHTYATKVAVDATGNVYVRGHFEDSLTIGTRTLTSAGLSDMFLAKFDDSGELTWVEQAAGAVDEGGVAVDPAGNVHVTGFFESATLNFPGTSLPNAGALDAFIAQYNSAGTVQWARRAGGAEVDIYWDVALDGDGNVYAAGVLGPAAPGPGGSGGATVVKYDAAGMPQWAHSATGPAAEPVPSLAAKCAVDFAGNCYLAGWYQGTATFDATVLQPQGYWNFFLAQIGSNLVQNLAPVVTTGTATAITPVSATINGTVNPNGLATTAEFEYGLSSAYGNAISVALSPDNGSTPQAVSATLDGLQPGLTYHFRLTAGNSAGLGIGGDATFTLPAVPVFTAVALTDAVPRLAIASVLGITNQIQCCTNLSQPDWVVLTNLLVTESPYWFMDVGAPPVPARFYRVAAFTNTPIPPSKVLISAGSFMMGATTNMGHEYYSSEVPQHSVYVSAFYMDRYEVTKALWDEVKSWNGGNGYVYENEGFGKAAEHPVHTVNWYDCVKWCNARSEKEGLTPCYYNEAGLTTVYKSGTNTPYAKWEANGYRLPTEAEWEKAARGGLSGQRFPWGNTITHSQANYYSYWSDGVPYFSYDVNPTSGYHPTFAPGGTPYTSPVGYFAANGYVLHDMVGNVSEWCWDWYSGTYYSSSPGTDPRGPSSGTSRLRRGGFWNNYANYARCADRSNSSPSNATYFLGFRCVRGL